MNGGIIGGKSRLTSPYRAGVWKPGDSDLSWVGEPLPTTGLIHHWPLTSDANDLIGGGTNLTNNNGVTFSEDGAYFVSGSKKYLSATITWPTEYTWVFETKIGSGLGLVLGSRASNADYTMATKINFSTYPQIYFQGQVLYGSSRVTVGASRNLDSLIDEGWHKVVQIRRSSANDGSDVANKPIYQIYIDSPFSMIGVATDIISINTSFAIGRIGAYDGEYQTGYCRNFRAYNRALSWAELMRLLAK